MPMLTKPCGRPGCEGLIRAKNQSILKRRVYCSFRCVQLISVEVRRRGHEDRVLRRTLDEIQASLGVSGPPPAQLVRIVRRVRTNGYRAGWQLVTNKVRRAVARGVLVRPGLRE